MEANTTHVRVDSSADGTADARFATAKYFKL